MLLFGDIFLHTVSVLRCPIVVNFVQAFEEALCEVFASPGFWPGVASLPDDKAFKTNVLRFTVVALGDV